MAAPLADRVRPATLDQVVGQQHILGPGRALRKIIEAGEVPNMVFYGPAGVGKTTVASIIAKNTKRHLVKLNGTTASTADIKEAVASTNTFEGINGVLLYLDEIQYFNKKQQQTLLEFMENGSITLIASTTENPYFYVYNAILSRSTVFEFKAVESGEIEKAVERAFRVLAEEEGRPILPEEGVCAHIASHCGGDVRKAMNAVELSTLACDSGGPHIEVTLEAARELTQKSTMRYDKGGDEHYDLMSAFQKSMRGSDPDATVHYLGRLLEAGDLLPPPAGVRLRGRGPGLAPDHPHCQGGGGRGFDGGPARGPHPPGGRGYFGGLGAQVQLRLQRLGQCHRRHQGGEGRAHPPEFAE